ncbi:hypothetical protein BX070DRAFT_219513 [Coemansia spiralis]|nr:hypothetical protein BX070DRAFT_219513 [Coemansia spiralis]
MSKRNLLFCASVLGGFVGRNCCVCISHSHIYAIFYLDFSFYLFGNINAMRVGAGYIHSDAGKKTNKPSTKRNKALYITNAHRRLEAPKGHIILFFFG